MNYPVLYIFNFNYPHIETALKRLQCSVKSIINQVDEIYILNASTQISLGINQFIELKNEIRKFIIINKPIKGYFNKSKIMQLNII